MSVFVPVRYRHPWPFGVTFSTGTNLADTNAAAAVHFVGGQASMQLPVPLSQATQGRFTVTRRNVASAAGYKIELMYATSYQSAAGGFSTMGSSAISVTCDGVNQYYDSGWVSLVSGAKIDACVVCPIASNGDGAADPNMGMVQAWFR